MIQMATKTWAKAFKMKTKIYASLLLLLFAALVAHAQEKKGGVAELAEVVGVLGATTIDATVGEIFVRAHPAISLIKQDLPSIPAQVELSCDTYRTGTSNHYMAAATACHIGYELKVISAGYTLTGPFKHNDSFDGRRCEEARAQCAGYKISLVQEDKRVNLFEGKTLVGSIDFSGLTPTYKMNDTP